jgi:hypothetical protein
MNQFSWSDAEFDLAQYPEPVARLLAEPRLNSLGPGQPNWAVEADLRRLSVHTIFDEGVCSDAPMANACLAGLWLLHDFLDESHRLSQEGDDVSFRFWHGIMHRREPDYGNAKYWFRRVGNHPIYGRLLAKTGELARDDAIAQADPGLRRLATSTSWDALAFVDLCEAASSARPTIKTLCQQIQAFEWRLLFDYCYRKAKG